MFPPLAALLALLVFASGADRAFADTEPPGAVAEQAAQPWDEDVLNRCSKSKGSSKTRVSFPPGATLGDLVSWAMSFSCKNFLYRSDLASRSAKVDIVAPSEMSPVQSWRLFQVAVQSLGLTIVRRGPVFHIVESAQAPQAALPIRKSASGGEAMERLIVQPEHISVDDVQRALAALRSPAGTIVALPSAQALLVTDYGAHTGRMADLLKQVDRPGANEELFAIHLRFADVDDVRKQLTNLLAMPESGAVRPPVPYKGKRKAAAPHTATTPSLIVADVRTGTLLLRASKATYLRALRIVQELDRKLERDDSSRIHIYALQHADATKLAATLNALTQRANASRSQIPIAGTPASGSGATISGEVDISADTETNSLLVLASQRDFLATKALIAKLDRLRPQVYLEVSILEVDLNNSLDVGGSFHLGSNAKNSLLFGGSQQSGSRTAPLRSLQQSALQDGLVAGALGSLLPTEEFLGVSIPSFAVLFQAVAEDRRIDILSAPHLMTTNNSKAKLSVGQNVPYKAGSSTAGGGVVDSIKREDVEMTLEVTPHVNLDGMVRLEVDLNIKELLPNQEGLEPSWTTRKIVNTVVVRDQESIAIGGMASEKQSVTKSKVPLLGDIPLVGALFRSTRKRKGKTNLMVLLTPYVLGSADEARRLTQRKIHEKDAFLRSYRTLRNRKFDASIDYAKKRGLLDEIRRAVEEEEAEAVALQELERQWQSPENGPL